MSGLLVRISRPADGRFQYTDDYTVGPCGPRVADRVFGEMHADPDRYLRGHSRSVAIFDPADGREPLRRADVLDASSEPSA